MAKVTNQELRNYMFYQVYNLHYHASETFVVLIKDLDRIKKFGIDVLYLLVIHSIGQKDKIKLGCPYLINRYSHEDKHTKRVEIFNFGVRPGVVSVNAIDGEYKHLIDNTLVTVKDNKVALSSRAILFDITK